MKQKTSFPVAALALFMLASCASSQETDLSTVRSARSGILTSLLLIEQVEAHEPIPAALAGIRSGAIFTDVHGIGGTPGGSFGEDFTEMDDDIITKTTRMINTIIELLVMDIQDLINSSDDRAEKLNEYSRELRRTVEDSKINLRSLETEVEQAKTDERSLKKRIRQLEDDMDDAIRAGESKNASSIVRDLTRAKSSLVEAETTLSIGKQLIDSLEEAIEPLQERLQAIEANRDALIKGVFVRDIPGVEEIGIIKRDDGSFSIRKRRSSGGFKMF